MPGARRRKTVADKWIARGRIEHGAGSGDNARMVSFQPGDEVKGLNDDEMQSLIEAGAVVKQSDLEKREAPSGPSEMENDLRKQVAERNDEIVQLKARIAELETAKASPPSQRTATK
jgi:hypothetical protein